jgi:hypothetical protein
VIAIRQVKYLNNLVEQDHRGVKRVTRPMLGFKAFDAAQCTLAGIELMHMLRKDQLEGGIEQGQTPAKQFYSLAAYSPARQGSLHHRSKFATHPAAHQGIFSKGGWYLEQLAAVDAIIVDKTGPLTLGAAEIIEVIPYGDGEPSAEGILVLVAGAQQRVPHPCWSMPEGRGLACRRPGQNAPVALRTHPGSRAEALAPGEERASASAGHCAEPAHRRPGADQRQRKGGRP